MVFAYIELRIDHFRWSRTLALNNLVTLSCLRAKLRSRRSPQLRALAWVAWYRVRVAFSECKSLSTSQVHAVTSRKRSLSSGGVKQYSCYISDQLGEWMQLSPNRSLWANDLRDVGVKMVGPEFRADCPRHTHAMARSYCSSNLCCRNIRVIHEMTFWGVWTSTSCANWLVCSS